MEAYQLEPRRRGYEMKGAQVLRELPGIWSAADKDHRYVAASSIVEFEKRFNRLGRYLCDLGGMPDRGSLITGNVSVTCPDGVILFAISFWGTVDWWTEHIDEWFISQGLLYARVQNEQLERTDGKVFSLSECVPDFY